MKRVLFYVQHLWGVGHVYRATRIAHGLKNAGFDVHLVWGGTQLPGFDFSGLNLHQLTPVRTSDASFSQLLHADGSIFTQEDEARRKDALLALYDEIKPDVLITEAFPFGRRQMRFELLPLLEKAISTPNPPLIAASIRDIMTENRKDKRVEESNGYVEKYFDLILVHGDPNMVRIEKTLQGTASFLEKIRYTGLVTPAPFVGEVEDCHKADVLVTVGGGAFGLSLLENAVTAMQFCKTFPDNWLLSAGSELSDENYAKLQASIPDGMRLVRHIPNLLGTMSACKVSVSHSGYNTVADLLRAGCASVLYPYTGGKESEQLRRSVLMEKLGAANMIGPDELSPQSIAETIDIAFAKQAQRPDLDLDGASRTAEILHREMS